MKKKIVSLTLAVIGLIIIGYGALTFLGAFEDQESGVLIESEPAAVVYINDQEVGNTPFESNLKPGEITIRIKPFSEDVILDDYETKINLVPGVRTIVKRVFKQTEEYSSGAVVSFEKMGGKESYLTVVSVPDNSQVVLNGKILGYTPLRVKIDPGDHNLTVVSNKYLDKTLPIRIYAGYKLTASIKLAKSDNLEVESKVETVDLGRLRVNDTDTGFLRVRQGNGTNFQVVSEIKPGEEYQILEISSDENWYKIMVGESEGWVSAEFVTLI